MNMMIRRHFLAAFVPFMAVRPAKRRTELAPTPNDQLYWSGSIGQCPEGYPRVVVKIGRAPEQAHRPDHERMAEALRTMADRVEKLGATFPIFGQPRA